MTGDELRAFLTQRGVVFEEREIPYGHQFRCSNGEVFNGYTKRGSVVVQGQETALSRDVKAWGEAGTRPAPPQNAAEAAAPEYGPDRRIFIVHGHDHQSRDQLELMLRRWGLEPIVLQLLPAGGDTIIEKLDRYLGEHGNVGFACVLLTPDDQGHRAGTPEEIKYRARQNVILELGMVLARVGRRRVAILYKESVEQPSDIAGLIYIAFKERLDETRERLGGELEAAGYQLRNRRGY